MKLARKQMITALLSMAAAGALAAPAMAQQGTFGGMPTVTPQSQLEAQKKQAAKKKSSSRKRKLPAYVVVDKGGPNAGLYDEADDSYDNDVSRARYTSINEAIKNVAWGGVVVVMPGVYEENIELERSVSLEGRRAGASGPRIRQVAAAAGEKQKPCLSFKPDSFNEHAQIANFDFEPLQDTATPCVQVKGGVFTMVESTVDGHGRHGGTLVSIEGGMAFLEENRISGGLTGVSVTQNHPVWDRAMLVNNIVSENTVEGVHFAGEASMVATGNLINANGIGINYNGSGVATLVGNKVLNNHSEGLLLGSGGKEVLVRLNQIWSNDGDGIKIENSSGLIEDNDIDGNGGFEVSTVGHLNTVPTIINDVAQNVSSPLYNRNNRRKADQSTWRVGNGPNGGSR